MEEEKKKKKDEAARKKQEQEVISTNPTEKFVLDNALLFWRIVVLNLSLFLIDGKAFKNEG